MLDAAGLNLYAFVVLDDGPYELQTYSRRRTTRGIDLYDGGWSTAGGCEPSRAEPSRPSGPAID